MRLVGNSDGIEAKFGAIGSNGSETDANAVAYADNLVWTSGTIVSGIISGAQASLIELSGSMQKGRAREANSGLNLPETPNTFWRTARA